MLLINGQRITEANCKEFGRIQSPMYEQVTNRLLGTIGLGFGQLASIPRAYGMNGILPCITAGSISSRIGNTLTFTGSAPINQGISISASGSILEFDGAAPLAALVNMLASGSVSFGGSANMFGVASMDASGGITFSGTAGLGGLFSISANGTLTFSGSAVTHSLAFLETTESGGTMTEATITAAVWSALAAAYNVPGTMGEKLNGAGSAGNPWTEIIEAGTSAAEIMRIILASVAGKSLTDGDEITFRDILDTKDRITGTVDADGNRLDVTLDGQ